MYRKIQKLKNSVYGKAEIAKILEMDPATIQKYYFMDLESYNRYRSKMEERKKIFEDFRQEIIAVTEHFCLIIKSLSREFGQNFLVY